MAGQKLVSISKTRGRADPSSMLCR
jgi:hypothetical protein